MKRRHARISARWLGLVALQLAFHPGGAVVVCAASPIKLNGPLVAGGDVFLTGLQFSPDSSRVLYNADQTTDFVNEIFSVPAAGGAAVQLNGPLVAGGSVSTGGLQFSPDGSRALYLADQTTDDVYDIFSVPSAGGAATKLNGPLVAGGDVTPYGLQFSPDGGRVLYQADQTADEVYEIFSVPAAGGAATKLNGPLVAGGGVFSNGLQFSPDGGRVLYYADQTTDEVFEIFSVPSAGGAATKLNGLLVAGGDVATGQFSPDGSRVLYLADQTTDQVFEIFSVPSAGGAATKLNGPLVAGGSVSTGGLQFSPDGSRVLYLADQTTDGVAEIFSVPSAGGAATKLNGPLVAGGDVSSGSQQFSPDGSRVLYNADQTTDGVFEIFSVPSAGGAAVKLNGPLVAGGDVGTQQFSPDGSRVLYYADQTTDGVLEIFSVPAAGGAATKLNGPLVAGGVVFSSGLQFSPDGSRVLYNADQTADEVDEIFLVPSTGGTLVKLNGPLVAGGDVSTGGLQFSPDGSRVLYYADQNTDDVFEIFVRVVRDRWDASGGSWDTAANWDTNVAPDEVMQVFIDTPAVVRVVGGSTPRLVNELRLGGGSGASVIELQSDAAITALNGFSILPGGVLRGDGVVDAGAATVTNSAGGEIRAGAGERLRLSSGTFTNAGRVETTGTSAATAEIEFSTPLTNAAATGLITGHDGTFRFTGGLTNDGSLAFTAGTMDVFGDVTNSATGKITVSGGGSLTFYDDVTMQGGTNVRVTAAGGLVGQVVFFGSYNGGTVGGGTAFIEGDHRPGNSPAMVSFGGDVAYGGASSLNVELGGLVPGAQHDQVNVTGSLALDGTLAVSTINGFVPTVGDRFTIATYGSRSGTFADITGQTPAPGVFLSEIYRVNDLILLATAPGEKTWGVDASGNASVGANWIGGVAPGGVGDVAAFTTIITAPRTVTIDAPLTLGTMRFDDNNNYTLAGPNTITLQHSGANHAAINVLNLHGNGQHTIAAPLLVVSDLDIAQNSAGELTLSGGLATNAGRMLFKTGSGTLSISGLQSYGVGTSFGHNGGTLNLLSDAGAGGANLTLVARSTVNFTSTQHLAALKIAENVTNTLTAGGGKVLLTNSLVVDTGAQLDLSDNDFVLRSTPANRLADAAEIESIIAGGFASFAWNGPGIHSSAAANDPNLLTALGVMLNDNGAGGSFHSVFSGEPVDANSVLVKYTYYGDADLSGSVDGTDYALIDNGFNFGLSGWFNGDFNYSGHVDGTDYALIDNAFNSQSGPLTAGPIGPAVPEPSTWALAALAAFGITAFRRRRSERPRVSYFSNTL